MEVLTHGRFLSPQVSGGGNNKKLLLLVQKLILSVDEVQGGNGVAVPRTCVASLLLPPGGCSKHGEHLSSEAHFGSNTE